MKTAIALGTRPEAIKLAPLIRKLRQQPPFEPVVVSTGQHRETLDQVLELFSIVPDYELGLMQSAQAIHQFTAAIITSLSAVLQTEKPALLIVQGDTATAFVAAYAAFLQMIPVAHVEAGLRTHLRYSPFPEEMNRQLIARLATYHFAVTEKNKRKLIQEDIAADQIWTVGSTAIDALLDVASRPYAFPEELRAVLDSGDKIVLATAHRRENLEHMRHCSATYTYG